MVEAALRDELQAGHGGDVGAEHVVGAAGLQAAVGREHRVAVGIEAGIGVGVVAGDLIALAGEDARIPAVVRLEGILQADVGARARLDAVVARELVPIEQVGVVEHEALGVLVGQVVLPDAVLPRDDLADGLDDVRAIARVGDPGIGHRHAAQRHAPGERGVADDARVVARHRRRDRRSC